MSDDLHQLESEIGLAMLADQFDLRKLLRTVRRGGGDEGTADNVRKLRRRLHASRRRRDRRLCKVPDFDFPPELPISNHLDAIADAMERHQVVVVSGETGSGKSTQLPKICLRQGRGIQGFIGHTQPRRLAARSIAARLADELNCSVGGHVGFKIRFTDSVGPDTLIKLMTDGILLAETRHDRFLEQYDTIIVDEAHERSLNIDFLLGYLKRLLPKRPDLRVIITSATIDARRFAEHFGSEDSPVPVIEVAGRTYPIETRYLPADVDHDGSGRDLGSDVAAAIETLRHEAPGDILVFLPTERDIRDAARHLRGWATARRTAYDILPLYARLSAADQQRVFRPGSKRRIVLATNVAESSLTVPRIRYVIDTGTARISRYSPRSKVQRLPVEPISQASSDQRRGRCGRIGPGICIRLYDEQDYLSRDRYTTPEIRRTSLAAVILQMLSLRLGDVAQFPFLDPPHRDAVRDGYQTLLELGAIDESRELTDLGRSMSRLPVDPRIARIVLAAEADGCLAEILIIAAGLEVQDPRIRPAGNESQADQKHAPLQHSSSDFMSYLRIWDFVHEMKAKLTRSQMRKACQEHFLSHARVREWQDVHRQLQLLSEQTGLTCNVRRDSYEAIHRALLSGLLPNIAMKSDRHRYLMAGGKEGYLWPGSAVFGRQPTWVVAFETVETTRRFLRTVARIKPQWIEPVATHLVERNYRRPYWSRKSGSVVANERVSLFGLPICPRRQVRYGEIDPGTSRHLFIQHALVEADFDSRVAFFDRNQSLVREMANAAARTRDASYLVSDSAQFSFYDERLPAFVYDTPSLRRWLKRAPKNEVQQLLMRQSDLVSDGPRDDASLDSFPPRIRCGSIELNVQYSFQPGADHDGLSVSVPVEALGQLDAQRLDWLVPGFLQEKTVALIRSLPKSIRRNLVPAPDSAREAIAQTPFAQGPFLPALAASLSKIANQTIPVSAFQLDKVPRHLHFQIRVVDAEGAVVAQGRDVARLQTSLGQQPAAATSFVETQWDADGIKEWDFGDFPEQEIIQRSGTTVTLFPALIDRGDSVSIRLMGQRAAADRATHGGLRRLFWIAEYADLRTQIDWFPRLAELELLAATMQQDEPLGDQLTERLAELSFCQDNHRIDSAESFEQARLRGRERIAVAVQELTDVVTPLVEWHHQVQLQLEQYGSSRWQNSVDDIRRQLAELTKNRFVVEVPWRWLREYPRFLRAITLRLERLKSAAFERDQDATKELQPLINACRERQHEHEQRGQFDPQLELYRWMLEEYRVSLFAQQLGTSLKVSTQRLEKQWMKVKY